MDFHGLACAFSVINTIEYFKTDIKKSDFAKFLFMASDTVKNFNYQQYIEGI